MTVCGIKHADGVCVMGKCPYVKKCCPAVWDKSGKVEMTNEEWFCALPTEVKATFLAIQMRLGVEFYRTDDERYQDHDWWVEWLKQPHREE